MGALFLMSEVPLYQVAAHAALAHHAVAPPTTKVVKSDGQTSPESGRDTSAFSSPRGGVATLHLEDRNGWVLGGGAEGGGGALEDLGWAEARELLGPVRSSNFFFCFTTFEPRVK